MLRTAEGLKLAMTWKLCLYVLATYCRSLFSSNSLISKRIDENNTIVIQEIITSSN